jgi:hypothetical protein
MSEFNLANLARSVSTIPNTPDPSPRLTTGTVARALRVSPEGVRYFVRVGQLPCERTVEGRRLFQVHDVQRLAGQRALAVVTPPLPTPRARTEPRQLRLRLFRPAGRKVT